jgi:hypothetical protein
MDTYRYRSFSVPSGLNFAAAVWLIISPWVLGFNDFTAMTWNLVISGAVVLLFSGVRLWGTNAISSLSWINAAIGVWVFISPWVFGDSAVASILWDCVITGAVVFLLGAWSAMVSERPPA